MVNVKLAELAVENEAADVTEHIIFDIETGPLPDDQLRSLYREPTLEEFVESCPSNWKRETCEGKYPDAKAADWQKFVDRAALDATTGQVVAIGIRAADGHTEIDGIDGPLDEEAVIRSFWADVSDGFNWRIPFIGFNILHFDLPFLIRRSWILGVTVPAGVRQARYFNDLFIDLMVVWQQGQREFVSLDTLAKAFGLPAKVTEVDGVPVSGATFHRLWAENRPVAEEYLRRDLEIPAELARRMGVV